MADSDKEIAVRITGDGVSANAAMKQTAEAVKNGVGDMQTALGKLGDGFGKVTAFMGGFTSVLAGVGLAAIQQMVDKFADGVEQTRDLARVLGITTNAVAGLQAALDDIGSTTGEYEAAAKGMQRQLANNEESLKKLGLVTRDAKGELRPLSDLMVEGIKVANEYKEGTDRNITAQQIFGKGVSGSSRLMLLNTETLEKNAQAAKELGLEVGQNATEAWEEYDSASDRAELSMKAVGRAIGETVMPAVTTLMEYFNSAAPVAIQVLRGALAGLTTAFLGLVNGVRLVWEVINAMVFSVAEPIAALGRALVDIVKGDFQGATNEMMNWPSNIGEAWEKAYTNMETSSAETAERIKRLWSSTLGDDGGTGSSGAVKGSKSATVKPEKVEKLTSRMGEWEAQLQERKVAYQKENDLREMSKEQELAYWSELARMSDVNVKERVELRKRTSSVELEILKGQRVEELALAEEHIQALKAKGLDYLASVKAEGQFKVDTGQMTQLELLRLDQELEMERYRITKDAVQARLDLLSKDPTKNVVALQKLNDELAAVEREHQQKGAGSQREIFKEQMKDWQGFFGSIGNAFGNVVNGLVTRTMTMGQAVKGLFSSLLGAVGNFLGQMVAKKVAAWAVEKMLATGQIATNAAVAGSGAAASQASIPVVGPGLALAAMAAVFAAVMGMSGRTPSARNGYDIPAGVNPLTQLHEEEMVLPKEQADTIRNMGNSSAPILINTAGGDFVRVGDVAKMLTKMGRNFKLVKT